MHNQAVQPARLTYGRVITRRAALNAAKVFVGGMVAYSLLPTSAQAQVSAPAPAPDEPRVTVTIVNKSKWDFHHLFLSNVAEAEWGPDQLGDQIMSSGARFELRNIPCDSYDIKLVDEDGDECVVEEVDICGSDQGWVITDEILLACQGYGEQAAS